MRPPDTPPATAERGAPPLGRAPAAPARPQGRVGSPAGRSLRPGALAAVLVATLGLGVLVAAPATAFDTRAGDDIVIAAGEVVADDLYVAADTVTVEGTIEGDLVVAARTVTVEGTVEGDLLAAAQTVVVDGTIEDDTRAIGQAVALGETAALGDDVVTAAFSLAAQEGSVIGGAVVHTGYQALLAGEVEEDVQGAMAAMELSGQVGGDVDLDVGGPEDGPTGVGFGPPPATTLPDVAPGLTVTDSAAVGGDLVYRSTAEGDIAAGAEISGAVVFEQEAEAVDDGEDQVRDGLDLVAERVVGSLRLLVTLLVVGALLVWLAPRSTAGASQALRERPASSLGLGLLALPAALVVSIVLFAATVLLGILLGIVTLGGLVGAVVGVGLAAQGLLVLAVAVAAGLVAPVVVSMLGGRLLLLRRPVDDGIGGRLLALAVGVLVYAVARAVPVLGTIVAVVVVVLGLGALVLLAWRGLGRRRRAAGDPGPAPVPAATAEAVAASPTAGPAPAAWGAPAAPPAPGVGPAPAVGPAPTVGAAPGAGAAPEVGPAAEQPPGDGPAGQGQGQSQPDEQPGAPRNDEGDRRTDPTDR